ncbi:MAG: 1-aminocyclopropane-1-carboxylate deaminase [Oceanicoccus sp.]|jgi:1-aminocyclopropane-1-carboxylate deaminase
MAAIQFAPLQTITAPLIQQQQLSLSVLRLDQLSADGAGNKHFKLLNNIAFAKTNGYRSLLSFGGAYSNHIHALAVAGKNHELATIGVIRGEPSQPLNATLQDAVAQGMHLHYVSRTEYRQRHQPEFQQQLAAQFKQSFIIPEGGSNSLGVKGCQHIVEHIQHRLADTYDVIALPCGTGATLAGVAAACADSKQVLGFSVLKNAHYMEQDIAAWLAALAADSDIEPQKVQEKNWRVEHDYHCGGYAKLSDDLLRFMHQFESDYAIPLEPVYSAKMFYGLMQMIEKKRFAAGSQIVAIHTGGLQGRRGMASRINKMING